MLERLKVSQTKTRRLTKSSRTSYTVVLPIEFIRHLKWQERQKLDITLEGKRLIIKDWKNNGGK